MMKIANLIPQKRRQRVLNNAFWYAVNYAAKDATRDQIDERVSGLVRAFLNQGFTPDEIRTAASQRVKL